MNKCMKHDCGCMRRRWRNSGVPLEPFSLKREREAGYFDEEGYFVAYKDDEPEDAWLASLPRGAPCCIMSERLYLPAQTHALELNPCHRSTGSVNQSTWG